MSKHTAAQAEKEAKRLRQFGWPETAAMVDELAALPPVKDPVTMNGTIRLSRPDGMAIVFDMRAAHPWPDGTAVTITKKEPQ